MHNMTIRQKLKGIFFMEPSSTLSQMLADTLPPGFISSLLDRLSGVYSDSHSAMINDPALGDNQARYVLGYYRRGACETVFERTAAEFGLIAKEISPETGGCSHIQVSNDTFDFSMCHVQANAGFPKHSDNREQSSQINSHMPQGDLFPINVSPTDCKLYGVFVHTEQLGNKAQFQSVCIGFPNTNFDDWIYEPIDLRDIQDIQIRQYQENIDSHATIQNSDPKWKTSQIDNSKKPNNEEGN